jgi:translation initiation factor 5B
VPVRLADVGEISRRDVVEAEVVRAKDPYLAAILGFNVKLLPDAEQEIKETGIPVFRGDIIYRVLEDYSRWVEAQRAAGVKAEMELLIRPGKMKILKGFVFRRNDPAIVGVEVLEGIVRPKYPVINGSGKRIGVVLRVQDQGKDVAEVGAGKQVAVSIDKPVVGRHIFEGDILYIDVPAKHAKTLSSKFRDYLSPAELALLDELANLSARNASGAVS